MDRHPDTQVLIVGDESCVGLFEPSQGIDFFVIGVVVGRDSSAYRYAGVAEVGVVNDRVGDVPVVVFGDPDIREVNVYLATSPDRNGSLTFGTSADNFLDAQTGSEWDPFTGGATSGPLKGSRLARLAWVSSFDWAWEDFYPNSRFYQSPR